VYAMLLFDMTISGSIPFEKLQEMKYLEAICMEVGRLYCCCHFIYMIGIVSSRRYDCIHRFQRRQSTAKRTMFCLMAQPSTKVRFSVDTKSSV
jgi:hypothetical protein